jgi:hypothetical protein
LRKLIRLISGQLIYVHGMIIKSFLSILFLTFLSGWIISCRSDSRAVKPAKQVFVSQGERFTIDTIAKDIRDTGDKFLSWKGSLFLGSLAYRHLNHLFIKADTVVKEERILTEQKWRVRVVKQGPDGLLYIGIDNGMLLRLKPFKE